MKIAGIVAEYNPFHSGHAHQIAKTRRAGATHVAAVMSGNFVQRGESAAAEKHVRAHAALLCGVDLVLELPLPRAMSTAERFAFGAVSMLQALGCVDLLSFGAEGPLEGLCAVAAALTEGGLDASIRRNLAVGVSFARARQDALAEALGPERASLVASPNNILAVEYLKAARRLGFSPKLLAVPRLGAAHDSALPQGGFASASMLRGLLLRGGLEPLRPYLPTPAYDCLAGELGRLLPADPARMERALLAVLRRMEPQEFARLPDLSEGLENRLFAAVRESASWAELLERAKSKRYPLARIRRLALSAYLGVTRELAEPPPPYLRVLGFNRRGLEVLGRARTTARLPLSHSLADLERFGPVCGEFARLEARAADLYTLALPQPLPCGFDYTCRPVMLKD